MIIGISARKKSGKDLVGHIIQYFTAVKSTQKPLFDYPECLEVINNYPKYKDWLNQNGWEIKKFADKLKDIVCLLIGCTKEQLEDEEFKNSELEEEWQWGRYTCLKITPRRMLQYLGTNLLRDQFHPNTWVNATMADYKPVGKNINIDRFLKTTIGNGLKANIKLHPILNDRYFPNWIITDVRFPNEIKAIKETGGIIIRVERSSIKQDDNHLSETALDDYDNFDYIIKNDDSIESLIIKVKEILIKEKIL